MTVDHLRQTEFGILWSDPWSDISDAKNMTLTLSYSFRYKKAELSYHGWPLLDTETLNEQCTSMILIIQYEINTIPKDHVIQKVLVFDVFL